MRHFEIQGICIKERFKVRLAIERDLRHTCRATGTKKGTIVPFHHSRKQLSLLITRAFDIVNVHIICWSSTGNLVNESKLFGGIEGMCSRWSSH